MLRYLVPCALLAALSGFTPVQQAEPNGLTVPAGVKQAGRAPVTPALPTYRIPYRLTDTKHLLVRAKINGKGPFNFIVDTGAPAVFVANEIAKQIGLAARPDGWAIVKRLEIEGGAQVEQIQVRLDDPMQLTGMNALGLAGARIDGIFGYNLLARFRMEIDLTQPKMIWTRVNTPPDLTPILPSVTDGKSDTPYTPPKSMAQMNSLAKMATTLLGKMKSETGLRGFVGIELVAESAPVKTPIIIGRENAGMEGAKQPSEAAPHTSNAVNNAVKIARVLPGSPAALAGLQAGDVARSVAVGAADLQAVHRNADVIRLVQTLAAEDVLHLQVQRGTRTLDFRVRAKKGGL